MTKTRPYMNVSYTRVTILLGAATESDGKPVNTDAVTPLDLVSVARVTPSHVPLTEGATPQGPSFGAWNPHTLARSYR